MMFLKASSGQGTWSHEQNLMFQDVYGQHCLAAGSPGDCKAFAVLITGCDLPVRYDIAIDICYCIYNVS